MISYAWKNNEDESGITYSLQVDEVPWKYKKALADAMKDWSVASFGWNVKSGNQLFVFKKLFKNEEEWKKWANAFPLEVREKRVWGSKETIITYKKAGK